jgi:hypothetical protein
MSEANANAKRCVLCRGKGILYLTGGTAYRTCRACAGLGVRYEDDLPPAKKSNARRGKVVKTQLADAFHAVHTVTAEGGMCHRSKPCTECPWRLDAPVGAFPAEAYRISAHTAYDMATHTFACHMAGKDRPLTCAGFLLRGAQHNLTVRIAKSERRVRTVTRDGVALYDSYRAMAEANGVAPDDPALEHCR